MITRPEILEGIRRHIQPIRGQENLKLLEIEPGHARLSIEMFKPVRQRARRVSLLPLRHCRRDVYLCL